jgi:glycosyltransferase family protein
MENKKISVIIPVYNKEKYVTKTIESVLNQTYKNLEIIIINDASTDNSKAICESFKDERIVMINNPKNLGAGATRNLGLSKVTGDFISFVDADDYICEDYYETLYKMIEDNNADIAECDFRRVKDYNFDFAKPENEEIRITNNVEKLKELYSEDEDEYVKTVVIWNKIYKKELFNGVQYPIGTWLDDEYVTYKLIYPAKKIASTNRVMYAYLQTDSSIMRSGYKERRVYDILWSYEQAYYFFKEKGNKELEQTVLLKHEFYCIELAQKTIKSDAMTDKDGVIYSIKKNFEEKATFVDMSDEKIRKKIEDIRQEVYSILRTKTLKLNREQHRYTDKKQQIKVLNIKDDIETIEEIINTKKSLCRYGDGEFLIVFKGKVGFQDSNSKLAERLREILVSNNENVMVGIPLQLKNKLDIYNNYAEFYWREYNKRNILKIFTILDEKKTYYSSQFTRFYMDMKDKSGCGEKAEKLKGIFKDKDLLIVEGEQSRLGVGNDFFDGAKSIQRILCPPRNAFDKYDEILKACLEFSKDKLVVIALGPTATVLAYDLGVQGYQALDLGHIDIEYEWYLRNADRKIPIENKYVNEAGGYLGDTEINDTKYLNSIVKRIN